MTQAASDDPSSGTIPPVRDHSRYGLGVDEAASAGEDAPGAGDMSVAVLAEAGAGRGWVVMSGVVDAAVFASGLAIDSLAEDATVPFAPSSLLQAETASARQTVQA